MERFYSQSGELCIVLKRHGTTALILRTAHTLAPYVVPVEHVKGASVWWQGRYFEDIDNALAYFNKEVGGGRQMLNSYDNPECAGCKNCRVVGCGTKLVEGRRTHITLYNCARNGALTCTSCNEKAAACGSNTDNGNR